MSAQKTGPQAASVGALSDVDTTTRNPVGTRIVGIDATGNSAEYIYLAGCVSTIVGSVVTFDELGATALIVANAKGPVAVAMGINNLTTTYGWYGIQGTFPTDVVANTADNSTIGRETTDGKVGDGRAAGDQIANAFCRGGGTVAAAICNCQFDHSYVDDFMGA